MGAKKSLDTERLLIFCEKPPCLGASERKNKRGAALDFAKGA